MQLTDTTTFVVPDHVLSRRAAGEFVLLNLDDESYFGLDAIGARVWELVEEGRTFGALIEALTDEFDVERPVLEADLGDLLDDLAGNGLVELKES